VRLRIALLGAIAALGGGVLAATALASATATPKLIGTVGPGFTITLKDAKGKKVKKLKPGKYAFVVTDKAAIHNFVVEKAQGGKFEKEITSVPFTGKKTVTINLTKGKWEYYCAPHESSMHGDFTVG
jgi:plastocyanin